MQPHHDPFPAWFEQLYARHTQVLAFAEIRRGLQALSSTYVQRRDRLAAGAALAGAGKRAAFALFYAPMHYLAVRAVMRAAPAAAGRIVDLGCGTGVAGAALAWAQARPAQVHGVDVSPWALGEARWNWRALGVAGTARRAGAAAPLPACDAVVAAYLVNELDAEGRAALLAALLRAAGAGVALRIVEPLARGCAPWWPAWEAAFAPFGARSLVVREQALLPPALALLHRAAGLRGGTVQARALAVGAGAAPCGPRGDAIRHRDDTVRKE